MPRTFVRTAVLFLLIAPLPSATATSGYLASARQRYPQIAGARLDSCSLCHTSGSSLNAYGQAYRSAGRNLASIEALDSDGDGHTNLAEISALTFPADRNDFPSSNTRTAGFVSFGDPSGSRFETALPCVAAGGTDLIFSQVAQDDTWFTGLAVINPNAAANDVTISVFRTDGTSAGTGTIRLEPNGRFSNLLFELVPGMPALSKGYFTVHATQPVFGFAVFGTQSLSVLSAVPPQ